MIVNNKQFFEKLENIKFIDENKIVNDNFYKSDYYEKYIDLSNIYNLGSLKVRAREPKMMFSGDCIDEFILDIELSGVRIKSNENRFYVSILDADNGISILKREIPFSEISQNLFSINLIESKNDIFKFANKFFKVCLIAVDDIGNVSKIETSNEIGSYLINPYSIVKFEKLIKFSIKNNILDKINITWPKTFITNSASNLEMLFNSFYLLLKNRNPKLNISFINDITISCNIKVEETKVTSNAKILLKNNDLFYLDNTIDTISSEVSFTSDIYVGDKTKDDMNIYITVPGIYNFKNFNIIGNRR